VQAASPRATPAWEDNLTFDIDNHVHYAVLPPTDPAVLFPFAAAAEAKELAGLSDLPALLY